MKKREIHYPRDGFHHAETRTCQGVLDLLGPGVFLGLTAPPARMDGRKVLTSCDYQVAHEVRRLIAVDKGWLAPFQYVAIHDETEREVCMKKLEEIVTYAPLFYCPEQKERFKSGELPKEWKRQFPKIFDQDDLRLTESQRKLHFFEWLGAIVIFQDTGHLSLVEKYEFERHIRKTELAARILPKNVFALIKQKGAQCPDLLVYSNDLRDWFFCEIKGDKDDLSDAQRSYFGQLSRASNKPVKVLRFKSL